MHPSAAHINETLHRYFDKVLVLTVRRFTDRHAKVQQQLEGIDFEFFYGTDKQQFTPDFVRQHYRYDKNVSLSVRQVFPPLNEGEIACALSHCNIYEAILANNWQRVLILEDDVVPDWDALAKLDKVLDELPEGWELVYLGYLKNNKRTAGLLLKQSWYHVMRALGMSKLSHRRTKHIAPQPFSTHLWRAGFHDCTHAYAVSVEGARKLLAAQTPVVYRADNLLTALVVDEQLQAYAVKEYLFNQEIFSDIDAPSHVRTHKPKKAE